MTQLASDASVIELGVPGAGAWTGHGRLPVLVRRRLLIALLTLLCMLTLVASARGRPTLGDPLWTGNVSLNGFTIGARNLYLWRLDGKAAIALDLFTGRARWSRDTTDLPNSIMDFGGGVTVVATTPPFVEGAIWQPTTITVIRDADGERIVQTAGEFYLPSADGRLLLIFSRRFDGQDRCGASEAAQICSDITAWDLASGTVAWKVNLPPNATWVPSIVDDRVEALAEIDADGTVKLRDLSAGAVSGTMRVPPDMVLGGQIGLAPGVVLTAIPGPDGITVTAYRQPALNRAWSVVVPDLSARDDQAGGQLYLTGCGPDVCMMVHGASTWVINKATGSVTRPTSLDVIARLGNGVFLASPPQQEPAAPDRAGQTKGVIVDPDGRTLATLAAVSLVDWSASRNRALLIQESGERSLFRVIDERGDVRSIGSVPGAHLTCHARADVLGCSDAGGTLRVWRLPV